MLIIQNLFNKTSIARPTALGLLGLSLFTAEGRALTPLFTLLGSILSFSYLVRKNVALLFQRLVTHL